MAKSYMTAKDVADELGVSMTKAYQIIRNLNAELQAKGYLVISGKTSRAYFKQKWYQGEGVD